MEEFDNYKEVKYLLAWFTLISITIEVYTIILPHWTQNL